MNHFTANVLRPLSVTGFLMLLTATAFSGTITPNYDANVTAAQRNIINDFIAFWEERTSCDMTLTIDISWADLGSVAPGPNDRPTGVDYSIGISPSGDRITWGQTFGYIDDADGYPSQAEIEFNNNAAVTWYFGAAEPVPAGETDFRTVATHELCHAVGFSNNHPGGLWQAHLSAGPGSHRTFRGCPDGTEALYEGASNHLEEITYDGQLMEPYLDPGERQDYHILIEHMLNCAYPCTDHDYFVLTLDASGSMSAKLPSHPDSTRFERALSWALQDLDNAIFVPGAHDQLRAAVMYFTTKYDPESVVQLGFTVDPDAVRDALNSIPAPTDDIGRTPLARAMSDAADIVHEMAEVNHRNIYVYTDGYENNSYHNSGSPVCGDCDSYLSGDVWDEINWSHQCDPIDCTDEPDFVSSTCKKYQCCMADRLENNSVINSRYFGEPVVKRGEAAIVERDDQSLMADASTTGWEQMSTGLKTGQSLPPDFAFLRHLALASGGTFHFECENNTPPAVSCPSDATIPWGSLYSGIASALDPDQVSELIFSLGPGAPPGMTIDSETGDIEWQTTGTDVCDYTITVIVTDICGDADTCDFNICVTNFRPLITCPEDTVRVYWGYTAGGSVTAHDPDYGPKPLGFSVANFDGPGGVAAIDIDPATGDWTWTTEEDLSYVGKFSLCIAVTDSANICDPCSPMNADTCCVPIRVKPRPAYVIEKVHDVFQGHFVDVSVIVDHSELDMGGFDFLIAYEAAALTFIEAEPGQLLTDCVWEHFTYRYGPTGNCGNACPSGMVRIVAMAETNNGPYHPSCYGPPDTDPHELARLTFYVTNDRTFECQYIPIYFFWGDCADNAVSSIDGDTLYVDLKIYDFEGDLIWNEEDDDVFPEDARIPFVGAPDSCLTGDKLKPFRLLDFKDGGIDIICADSIDVRCDINLNGIPYEIADAVAFINCLINPRECSEAAIAASDCNGDGIPLSIADLVYLIRVILGDAVPYPKVPPQSSDAIVSALVNHSAAAVSVASPVDIGGGYFEFEYIGYEIGEPHLINGASDMTLKYGLEDGMLRVVVYSMEKDRKIPAGDEHIFAIPISGDGEITLTDVELSDYNGNIVTSRTVSEPALPAQYTLHQSYPNPFNASATIMYELPAATHVKLDIYNTLGQRVKTLIDGEETAGIHSVIWDGTNTSGKTVASGVYVYRITTTEFSDEKKMVLMK